MYRAVFCACVLAFSLAACSSAPLREDVIAQAEQDGKIAFAVVKVDPAVITVLAEQPPAAFHQRFKKYQPPPELKLAVGDTVSVVIWESAETGLFGPSLTALPPSMGTAGRLGLGSLPGFDVRAPRRQREGATEDDAARMLDGAAASALLGVPVQAPGAAPPRAGVLPGLRLDNPAALRHSGLAEQTGRAGTRISDQVVGPDGAITIPYAGRVKAVGKSPDELGRRIEKLLGPLALEPQVLVSVTRSPAHAVTVAGEAIDAARVPLSPGGTRLLGVIAAAGGPKAPVHEIFVRLSRGGITATIPLTTLVADPDQNIFARPGDVLTLQRRPQTLAVFGEAGKNTTVTFATERMTLSEALAKAGGLRDDRADPRAVFLMRYEPVKVVRALGQPVAADAPVGLSPIVYRLDLSEAGSFLLAKRFPVQDRDIIFVAQAKAVPVMEALRALSKITGPITRGFLICRSTKAC